MTPITPVLIAPAATPLLWPVGELEERVYARDQEAYQTLPGIASKAGRVTTRWRLSIAERLRVLWTGNLYLQQLTFNRPLQPLKPSVDEPSVEDCI